MSACARFDAGLAWELLEDEGVTHLCCAPTVAVALAHDPAAHRLARPVTVVTGGAPPVADAARPHGRARPPAIHAYGLTETYGPSAACTWHAEWDSKPTEERARLLARQGVGHLTVGQVEVVDGELAPVPADASVMGEVVVRGNTVMKGYYRDPEATAQSVRRRVVPHRRPRRASTRTATWSCATVRRT